MTVTTEGARGGFGAGREGSPLRQATRRVRTAVVRLASIRYFGATPTEADDPMPGDGLVPAPLYQITQAVTVAASPETVWPWIMQSGQGKAGFYSDSRLWNACVDLRSAVYGPRPAGPRPRSNAMGTFTRDNTDLALDIDGSGQQHTRTEAGGMTIALERWHAGLDTARWFADLPGGACQEPHWGTA